MEEDVCQRWAPRWNTGRSFSRNAFLTHEWMHTCRFVVDDIPIRVFTNNEDAGMAFPNQQPMNIFSSIWNGDQWATQGGRVKIDWAHAPFIAAYQNYHLDACVAADAYAPCAMPVANQWWDQAQFQALSPSQQDRLRWVEENYMVYNYCSDEKRNPSVPFECTRNSGGFLGLRTHN